MATFNVCPPCPLYVTLTYKTGFLLPQIEFGYLKPSIHVQAIPPLHTPSGPFSFVPCLYLDNDTN